MVSLLLKKAIGRLVCLMMALKEPGIKGVAE
jgi:hypothetical protein